MFTHFSFAIYCSCMILGKIFSQITSLLKRRKRRSLQPFSHVQILTSSFLLLFGKMKEMSEEKKWDKTFALCCKSYLISKLLKWSLIAIMPKLNSHYLLGHTLKYWSQHGSSLIFLFLWDPIQMWTRKGSNPKNSFDLMDLTCFISLSF